MKEHDEAGCLRGLRLAVTIPPRDWFGGVDYNFAVDMALELRNMGATLLELDVTRLADRDPSCIADAVEGLEAFDPDLALSLPNAGYALVCRDLAGNNIFFDLLDIPTVLIWDHGIFQLSGLLLEPLPESATESAKRCLVRMKRVLDHPLLLHYSPDQGHVALMEQLGIVDSRNVRSFVQGAFPVYVRHGRRHAGESPSLNPRLAFLGNVYVGRAAGLPFRTHPVLRGIESRMLQAKRDEIRGHLWDLLMAQIGQLDEPTRTELALTPDSSFFWTFVNDEILVVGNTDFRLSVLTSLKRDLAFYGNFVEPEMASGLQNQYGIRPESSLNCLTELPSLYQNCGVLVDVINTGYFSGSSPKITSCFASGGFALFDYKDDFRAAFGEIADLVMYRSIDHLNSLIDDYLGNPARRREVGREVQHEVFARFTFSAMCRRILVEEPAWRAATGGKFRKMLRRVRPDYWRRPVTRIGSQARNSAPSLSQSLFNSLPRKEAEVPHRRISDTGNSCSAYRAMPGTLW